MTEIDQLIVICNNLWDLIDSHDVSVVSKASLLIHDISQWRESICDAFRINKRFSRPFYPNSILGMDSVVTMATNRDVLSALGYNPGEIIRIHKTAWRLYNILNSPGYQKGTVIVQYSQRILHPIAI